MNELDLAASVLAVLALPLAGIGPVLLRTLPAALVGAGMGACAVLVLLLTREPWAATFTLCLGAAVLLRHWRGRRRAAARARPAPRALPGAADGEGDLA